MAVQCLLVIVLSFHFGNFQLKHMGVLAASKYSFYQMLENILMTLKKEKRTAIILLIQTGLKKLFIINLSG